MENAAAPTNYVFNAQNTREIASGNGLTLATGDTVIVEQGGWVKAVAPGPGDGILIADLTNRVVINGLVESDNKNGIGIGAAGGAVTVGAGGEVRGIASGIFSTGSTAIWNYGKISDTDQTAPELKPAISVTSSAAIFSLFNVGEVIGNITALARYNNIVNYGSIQGKINFGNSPDIYDGRTGTITGTVSFGGGNDVAYGGAGGETFLDGIGNDFYDGGEGVDTVIFEGLDSITVDLRWADQ